MEYGIAKICVEQVLDLQMTLRYLIVPFRGRIYMFGDDEYVVNSSVVPHAKLLKQLNTLSFHHVHEAITSGCLYLHT